MASAIKIRMMQGADGTYLHAGDVIKALNDGSEWMKDRDGAIAYKALASVLTECTLNPGPFLPVSF